MSKYILYVYIYIYVYIYMYIYILNICNLYIYISLPLVAKTRSLARLLCMLAIHLSSSSLFGMAYVHTPLPLAVQDIDFWTAQRTDEGINGDPIDPVFSDP